MYLVQSIAVLPGKPGEGTVSLVAEFATNAVAVVFGAFGRDAKRVGHLLVGEVVGDEQQGCPFAGGECP